MNATVFIMNDVGKVLTQFNSDDLILPRVGEYFSYSDYPTTRDNSKPSFRCEGVVKEIEHETCYNYEFHRHHQYIYIVISKIRQTEANNEAKGKSLVAHSEFIRKFREENEKLRCLSLHLFKRLAYHECNDWNAILCGLAESKIKNKCVRNTDRWWRIAKRCNDAYREAKKKLMEELSVD